MKLVIRFMAASVWVIAAQPHGFARAQTSKPVGAPAPTAARVEASTLEARRLSEGFVAVAERVSPSVVQIDVTVRDERQDLLMGFLGHGGNDGPVARGTGSGVIFTANGDILTNNHVVEAALTINVRLRDGRVLPAHLVGRDPATDLAVLKVEANRLEPAKLANSDTARVGEWVVAIGSPFGLGYTVTAGVLSAKGRGGLGMNLIEDYLQTDASINPGNSGGPLCNLSGEVIGINTMIVGRGQGIGFAVPSNMAERVANQILKTGHVSRAWIGVAVQDLDPTLAAAVRWEAGAGALVNNVAADGPAFKANIRPGDVVAVVGGHPVHDAHDLVRETLAEEPGQPLVLEIVRSGTRYAASVVPIERPEPALPAVPVQETSSRPGLGMTVRDLTPEQAVQVGTSSKSGAEIVEVSPGSPADRAGLRPGDIIVEANADRAPDSQRIAALARSGKLLLRVKRADAYFYAALER